MAAVAAGAVATAGPALIPRGGDGERAPAANPLAFGLNMVQGPAQTTTQGSAEHAGVGGTNVAPEIVPLIDDKLTAAEDADDTADLAKGQRIAEEQRAAAEEAERQRLAEQAARAAEAGGSVLAPPGSVVAPAQGRLTSGFGARWGSSHNGIDIANDIGTPILAATDGTVVESGPASGFGRWVRLQHADGTITVYGHINRSLVEEGQQVRAGEKIAEMGNRGFSTGPHLHFEVWEGEGGSKVNPRSWLQERGVEL